MRLMPFIAHAVFAFSLLAFGYTIKNYLSLTRVTLPVLEAVAPVTADKTVQAIALHLPTSHQGNSARKLVQSQANQLRMFHEHWLSHTQLHLVYVRNQLIAWAIVSLFSFILVVLSHGRHKTAA